MIIALLGPHAIGKSTALNRWIHHFGNRGLIGVHCDNNQKVSAAGTEIERGWSGTTEQKQRLALHCALSKSIFVLEGNTARSIPWAKSVPSHIIIHVTCSPERFGELMQSRCDAKGKKYRSDYWDYKKLEYESRRRLANAITNYHITCPVIEFFIEDQTKDWVHVDAYFCKVFRKLYNYSMRLP